MATYLYRCPTTGFQVQGWSADDTADDASSTYQGVICLACGQLHLVHPKTGKTPGDGVVRTSVKTQ